jgi:WhiB family transcriptional regulator, redox-sensing transcriptional regulator
MAVQVNRREDVACHDADPDLFCPAGTTVAALRQMEEAKRICRVCLVQIQCLASALGNPNTDGVWGGTMPDERRVIRSLPGRTTISKNMTMPRVVTQQSNENMEYVRMLLQEKQPGFSAALELALASADLELKPPHMQAETSARVDEQRSGVPGRERRNGPT